MGVFSREPKWRRRIIFSLLALMQKRCGIKRLGGAAKIFIWPTILKSYSIWRPPLLVLSRGTSSTLEFSTLPYGSLRDLKIT
ncbi:hypothetical protein HanHA300_Chr04g0141271 [Helianthus annuus]|nr:hypothetical protein HanHA300_Chr04g0141271 [Helianthus annuus]KAJ0597404.1 hypothetical protein HanHA89_Chr04g0154221 [Helianthus annuus]KAJ0758066.1 hypothetical protein HanLR1_Chr04g0146081 [Helianthus annuus]